MSKKLSEEDWKKVFAAPCQSKQGRPISAEERALCNAAFKSAPKRYSRLDAEVFNATVPFGSSSKMKPR